MKGRGVSWLFVLHCSHPCDQSREETFRALLQERHVVCFFIKGSTTSKSAFVLCFKEELKNNSLKNILDGLYYLRSFHFFSI